jgi:hypothetical protein
LRTDLPASMDSTLYPRRTIRASSMILLSDMRWGGSRREGRGCELHTQGSSGKMTSALWHLCRAHEHNCCSDIVAWSCMSCNEPLHVSVEHWGETEGASKAPLSPFRVRRLPQHIVEPQACQGCMSVCYCFKSAGEHEHHILTGAICT